MHRQKLKQLLEVDYTFYDDSSQELLHYLRKQAALLPVFLPLISDPIAMIMIAISALQLDNVVLRNPLIRIASMRSQSSAVRNNRAFVYQTEMKQMQLWSTPLRREDDQLIERLFGGYSGETNWNQM